LDRVLSDRFGRRGSTAVYLAFVVAGLAALLGFAWHQVQAGRIAASETTLVAKSVKPEHEPATTRPAPGGASARLEISEPLWNRGAEGGYRLATNIHVVSKFQRSGLLLMFKSEGIEGMRKLLPVNKQPTVHGTHAQDAGAYVHYIQRPWGQYFLTLGLRTNADVVFTYRFEGETESSPVLWKAP
jgi:hypothetical protein